MTITIYENGEHITMKIESIETTICVDDLLITYFEGFDLKEKIIEKSMIHSIDVKY